MLGEELHHHLITTMDITMMVEGTTGVIAMIDMTITEDLMAAVEEMTMDLLLLTHLIDMKTNVATIAIMDGMMMRGDITTITTTIVTVVADDEGHLLPLDYPNLKSHRHLLVPIAN
jgi:hypothetical protein